MNGTSQNNAAPAMIEIAHLSKSFGTLQAVDDLSLVIPQGELFCFIGPNGAGKTTTIKLLCGLLRPDSGEIKIGGMDLRADPMAAHEIIGYIPDTPYLYERLTPVEFFEFIGNLYKIRQKEIDDERVRAFQLFGLEEYAGTLIKDLSYGFRQRLIYAATFLHKPKVFFVDEPFIGLDPYSIRLIRNLLRQKARAGATIFMTTHILALAEDLADRIGIISNGRLSALGTLTELQTLSNVKGPLEDIFFSLTENKT